MKFPVAFLTLFLTLAVANASTPHNGGLTARHAHIARVSTLEKKGPPKRCPNRKKTNKNLVAASSGKNEPTSSKAASPPPEKTPTTNSYSNGGGEGSGGTIKASGKCGGSGATGKTTKTSGPNGSIDFLNCGINGGGWSPPFIRIQDVVVKPLSEAIKSPGSPFKACSPYVGFFNKYGGAYGIPPIFLASFAMQESSCNPSTVGGGGEQGLMQITKEKCKGAPGGNCRDPDFNIRTGAKYFADTLAANGGDLLKSLGQYNGWYPGLTVNKATAARWTSCCRCQNNLDYLHQFLNGWCQNINAYDSGLRLGKYFNLDTCH